MKLWNEQPSARGLKLAEINARCFELLTASVHLNTGKKSKRQYRRPEMISS